MAVSMRLDKLSLVIVLLVFSRFSVAAIGNDTTKVHFFVGTFKEVLSEAKRVNKPVFIDVSTTWCKPCKLMKKEAFTDKRIATFFNTNFVSYEIDAERGEGKFIAGEYGVTGYPTLLFVLPDSTLIWRSDGYDGISPLLTTASNALASISDSNSIYFYKKKYIDGERTVNFLVSYIKKMTSLGLPSGKVLDVYLQKIPDTAIGSVEIRNFIMENLLTTESVGFDRLVNYLNEAVAENSSGRMEVSLVLYNAWMADFQRFVGNRDDAGFERLIGRYSRILTYVPGFDTINTTASIASRRSDYYRKTGNLIKYRPYAYREANALMLMQRDSLKKLDSISYNGFIKDMSRFPDSTRIRLIAKIGMKERTRQTTNYAKALNEIAAFFVDFKCNSQDLKDAERWCIRSMNLYQYYSNVNTYAKIMYRRDCKDKAILMQRKAINMAKSEGVTSTFLEEELSKMRSKK